MRPNPIRLLRLSAPTLLAWLLPVFAWAPLAYPGYFEFHTGFLPIFNLNDLMRHLTDFGWAATVGQHHDLLRGDRVLPYLFAVLPRAIGGSPVAAVKWVFGASLLAGSLGMYGWARRRLGAWPALLAAMLYLYAPVVLATTYVRGAFAEAAFLGLMPWVLWAADAALNGRRAAILGMAFALAAALWTQTGLALWLAGIVFLLLLRRIAGGQWKSAGIPLAAWGGGLALGALGLLPVALRHGWGDAAQIDVAAHLVYPHQLLLAGWGPGPSLPGPDDTLPFSVGAVAFGLAVLACFLGRSAITDDLPANPTDHASRNTSTFAWRFALMVTLALLILSTTLAMPIWRMLPFLIRTLTYPWQLLLLAAPWLAWLGGLGGYRLLDLLPNGREDAGSESAPSRSERHGMQENHPDTLPLNAILLALVLFSAYDDLAPLRTKAQVGEAPVAILGDDQIAVLSAVPAGTPGPSSTIILSVRWQALRPLNQDYTVFFHALGPDGNRWGQQDVMPQGGKRPTSQWQPGQVIEDRYELVLAPEAPIGDYRYLLGMYEWRTGERLRVGVDDKVVVMP